MKPPPPPRLLQQTPLFQPILEDFTAPCDVDKGILHHLLNLSNGVLWLCWNPHPPPTGRSCLLQWFREFLWNWGRLLVGRKYTKHFGGQARIFAICNCPKPGLTAALSVWGHVTAQPPLSQALDVTVWFGRSTCPEHGRLGKRCCLCVPREKERFPLCF